MVRKTENLRQCYPEILMPTMGASNSTSMPAKCQKKKPPQARHNIYKIWRCDNVEETSLATQFVIGTLRKKASPDVPCSFASLRL